MITEVLPKAKQWPPKASDIVIQGYQMFSNIDETSYRGVVLYLSNKFRAKRLDYSSRDSPLECLFVEIKKSMKRTTSFVGSFTEVLQKITTSLYFD